MYWRYIYFLASRIDLYKFTSKHTQISTYKQHAMKDYIFLNTTWEIHSNNKKVKQNYMNMILHY